VSSQKISVDPCCEIKSNISRQQIYCDVGFQYRSIDKVPEDVLCNFLQFVGVNRKYTSQINDGSSVNDKSKTDLAIAKESRLDFLDAALEGQNRHSLTQGKP